MRVRRTRMHAREHSERMVLCCPKLQHHLLLRMAEPSTSGALRPSDINQAITEHNSPNCGEFVLDRMSVVSVTL